MAGLLDYDANADAERVAREGGPRMVLSGNAPLYPAPAPNPAPTPAPALTPAVQAPPTRNSRQADFIAQITPHAIAAGQATGVDPRMIIAQSALETNYGKSAPGNNYFGIKGPGQRLATKEVVNGQTVGVSDSFRRYDDMGQSAQDYANFLNKNKRYAAYRAAQGLEAQADALQRSGYATDPKYGAKVLKIAQGLPDLSGGAGPMMTPAAYPQVADDGTALPQVQRTQVAGAPVPPARPASINPDVPAEGSRTVQLQGTPNTPGGFAVPGGEPATTGSTAPASMGLLDRLKNAPASAWVKAIDGTMKGIAPLFAGKPSGIAGPNPGSLTVGMHKPQSTPIGLLAPSWTPGQKRKDNPRGLL